jgi:peptidoglycan/LPS O-acetylase OafA/YrhL
MRAPDPYGFAMLTVGYSWLALFYLCVILCGLVYRQSWLGACLRWGWLGWLGSIAYGVYLFHELVRGAFRGLLASGSPSQWSPREPLVSLVALAATLLVCRLSWIFFEKPLIQLGHRKHYESISAQAVGSVLTFGTEKTA